MALFQQISQFQFGDMQITYLLDKENFSVGWQIIPASMAHMLPDEKRFCAIEPLIQVKLSGDEAPPGHSQGRTMRNAMTVSQIKYSEQKVEQAGGQLWIKTYMKDARGALYEHVAGGLVKGNIIKVRSAVCNHACHTIQLELFSSFTLGGLTPFSPDDAYGQLVLHRMRSTWSAEGRMESIPVEALQLEPSWLRFSANGIRFGQVGSMPVNGFFPFIAVEDRTSRVCWCIQLSSTSSWQLEAYRKDNGLSVSGGLADRELGHWTKNLAPGECFSSPECMISVASGVEEAAQRIAEQSCPLAVPVAEKTLPVIFNEFCSSWGEPTIDTVKSNVDALTGKGITYFVIDAGWYREEAESWSTCMGDWLPNKTAFPNGLSGATEYIRAHGMIPGIWFEFEVCGLNFQQHPDDWYLQRDGLPIKAGGRRFLNMTRPDVQNFLSKRVIGTLKRDGFGYIKIDYNETIGIGCDGEESFGEALRANMEATISFFKKLKEAIPELVIENCSSGGHRLCSPFLQLSDMSSFSDAHECDEIPIIAANLRHVISPKQSQIWVVLRKESNLKKIYYQMCSSFLGRCCLSGDISELSGEQWSVVEQGLAFYKKSSPIIERGFSKKLGPDVKSYRHPEGWQCILRKSDVHHSLLAVIHTFTDFSGKQLAFDLPLSCNYRIQEVYGRRPDCAVLMNQKLIIEGLEEFDGCAVLLTANP